MDQSKSILITIISVLLIIVASLSIMLFSTTADPAARALSFTEASSGLPTDGGYNYVAFGDFNRDGEVDMAFGGENYGGGINTVGLYAYTGDGGSSWIDASANLPTENSWGGLQLVDADADGYMELYATDESWGTSSNAGLKAFEYRDTGWTDSVLQVTSPIPAGTPNNVVITDITGDAKLDMIVALKNGFQYFENSGGNPAVWLDRSTGLATGGEFTAVAVADLNGDDLMDIVTADYSGNEYVYIQSGTGTLWTNYGDSISTDGVTLGTTVGDVDGDGNQDIVVGTRDDGLRCWLGNSGGGSGTTDFTWEDASTNLPTSGRYAQIQVIDIDLDGDQDLLAPEGNGNKGIEVYLGDGNAGAGTTFAWTKSDSTGLTTSGNWYGANVYDINGDGSPDVGAASWGSGIKAYLNAASGTLPTDTTPPSGVTDLALVNVTEDSVSLTWTAPGDDGASGTASMYDLRFAENEINVANWNVALPIEGEQAPKEGGQAESITITGLEQNTTYYFAIITADEVPNWSPVSNSPTGTTLGVAKPALDVTITPEKTNIKPGEDIDITIVVKSADDQSTVPNAQVAISSENSDLVISPDSGLTDAIGVMSASLTPPDVTKPTEVVIQIDVVKDTYKTSKNRITITVNPPDSVSKSNLRITTNDIKFSQSPINDGDAVTITAEIANNGKQDATGFTVRFYVDGTQLGTDEAFTQLKASGTLKVDQSWKATEGSHRIKVEMIPVDTGLESDENDNSAEVTINVAGESTDGDSDEGGFPLWIWLVIIVIFIIVAVGIIMSKKKGPVEAEEVDEERPRKRDN